MREPVRWIFRSSASLLAVIVAVAHPVRATEPGPAGIRISTPMPPPGWALLERELCAPRSAPVPSSSTGTSTTGAISNASSDGEATTGRTTRSRTSMTGRSSTRWAVPIPSCAFQESLGGPPQAVHRSPHHRGAIRTRRDVLQGIPRHVRLVPPGRRAVGLQPRRSLRSPGFSLPAARRRGYAGFYLGDDPGAPNYDPKFKIIRSLFNGSRGPLLRKATALDWAGDPIEVEGRFRLGHGEHTYAQMLAHFKDYNDIIGDHPLNLARPTWRSTPTC